MKITDSIALRNYCNTVVIGIIGGLIGLLYNFSIMNVILFVVGLLVGYRFMQKSYNLSKKITTLTNKIKEVR